MSSSGVRVKPNLVGCPKCGSPSGFVDIDPHYIQKPNGAKVSEWLEWSCKICSYTIHTKVFIPNKPND